MCDFHFHQHHFSNIFVFCWDTVETVGRWTHKVTTELNVEDILILKGINVLNQVCSYRKCKSFTSHLLEQADTAVLLACAC